MIDGRKVITLCGSRSFKEDFERVNSELTLEGKIVISLGVFGREVTDDEKKLLDAIHISKINLADSIYVIDKGGYFGDSTAKEIEHALQTKKQVDYMEPPSKESITRLQKFATTQARVA